MLSVVIPTCNRNDLLALCLDKLAPGNQSLSFDSYEVIVTDDGKTASALEMIHSQFPWAKWVEGPRRGPAANRNNGAKNATYNWLVFTDDDCLPHPKWLETFYEAISVHPSIRSWEGAIHPTDWKALKKDMAECPINIEGGCFWSANIAIERVLFETLGGFDEKYLIAAQEDQDIYLHLKVVTEIPFLRECIVEHPVRTVGIGKKLLGMKRNASNWLYYAVKNKTQLGYTSKWSIIKSGYASQIIDLKSNLSKLYFGKALIALCWLIYGMPFIIFSMLKLRHEFEK